MFPIPDKARKTQRAFNGRAVMKLQFALLALKLSQDTQAFSLMREIHNESYSGSSWLKGLNSGHE